MVFACTVEGSTFAGIFLGLTVEFEADVDGATKESVPSVDSLVTTDAFIALISLEILLKKLLVSFLMVLLDLFESFPIVLITSFKSLSSLILISFRATFLESLSIDFCSLIYSTEILAKYGNYSLFYLLLQLI